MYKNLPSGGAIRRPCLRMPARIHVLPAVLTFHEKGSMHTRKVRRTGSVPQQEALAIRKAVIARLYPRVCLFLPEQILNTDHPLLRYGTLPLDAERVLHLHLIVSMRRTVGIARVHLERAELLAAPCDRLHLRKVKREEVLVQRIEWAAVCVLGHGGRDELRGDFLRGLWHEQVESRTRRL